MRFRSEHTAEPEDSDRRGNYAQVLQLLAEKDNLDTVSPSQVILRKILLIPLLSSDVENLKEVEMCCLLQQLWLKQLIFGINLNQQELCALCHQTVRSAIYLCNSVIPETTELLLVVYNICSAIRMN
jgi:hypothetical protein